MFLSATFMVQKAAFIRGSCNKNENYSRDGDSVQQDSRLRNAKMNAFWPECFFAVSKALLSFCCKSSNGFENFHLLVAETVTESFTVTICNEKIRSNRHCFKKYNDSNCAIFTFTFSVYVVPFDHCEVQIYVACFLNALSV